MVDMAYNLTAICKLAVYKMWEPLQYINLCASTACSTDNLLFLSTENICFRERTCIKETQFTLDKYINYIPSVMLTQEWKRSTDIKWGIICIEC
jgi:hypothetical protein